MKEMEATKKGAGKGKASPACRACIEGMIAGILAPNSERHREAVLANLDSGDMMPAEVTKRILTVKMESMEFNYKDKCVDVLREACKMARDSGGKRSIIDAYERQAGGDIWNGSVCSPERSRTAGEVTS